ncbi:MAG: hypothetical protein AB1657_04140 [Candidatus Micrarchaeota archaeon]
MIVRNKTRRMQTEALTAFSAFRKIRGLMFRPGPVSILFDFGAEGIHPIHSLFVFFPFCAVYMDSGGRVTEKFRVGPFSLLCKNSWPARYLLETDLETGESFSPGDEVDFDAGMENH